MKKDTEITKTVKTRKFKKLGHIMRNEGCGLFVSRNNLMDQSWKRGDPTEQEFFG